MNSCQKSAALIAATRKSGKARRIAGALGSAAFIFATVCARAETLTISHWPEDADLIPCSEWEKASDGTWVLTGRIKVGASEITNVGVKGDAAAREIEKKCGKK